MDYFKEVGLSYNPDDDTFTRFSRKSTTTEAHNSVPNQTIFTKDIPLNPANKTWLRLYKPMINPPPHTKLPLILYFHGGGFVVCSAFDFDIHAACTAMANELPAVILSVEYRLSPESRLPAAYEDAAEALDWIQNQALNNPNGDFNEVDFTKVYVMGSSAGGNIAYHAGLHALSVNREPMEIRGYIFDHPFFSGEERTGSEMRLANDPCLPLAACDAAWELSLPKGCNRDHEYSNPVAEGSFKDDIAMLPRCFVNTRGRDPLVDFHMKFANMLEGNGVHVVTRFEEQGGHCMDIEQLGDDGKALFDALKQFISYSN